MCLSVHINLHPSFVLSLYALYICGAGLSGSVGCASDWSSGVCRFDPRRQHSFVEIDHELFSMVVLSLLLIQEGQLSVSGKRMCTLGILVNRLEG